MTTASAPGKVILLGEHAVVYGQPALAVPVHQVRASARVLPLSESDAAGFRILAPDIGLQALLGELPDDDPLARAVRLTLEACGTDSPPPVSLTLESGIPVAAGLGSGAAISVAIVRALSQFLDHPLPPARQSEIAFEVEKLHHGTPSGIDNTVVTYGQPVYFVKGKPPAPFDIGRPFSLAIADSGEPSPTGQAVAKVRVAYEADPGRMGRIIEAIGTLVEEGRRAIAAGEVEQLGDLMDSNQARLAELGVSTPHLERLIAAARQAGALGAKLSGGGLGGNIIALLPEGDDGQVAKALKRAGAAGVLRTKVDNA